MSTMIARQIRRFRRDQRGNVVMIFALSLLPMFAAFGCAIDLGRASQIRTELQAAADAASVGSVAKSSPAFAAAGSMASDGPIPTGVTDAINIFNGDMAGRTGYTLNSLTITVVKASGSVNSNVQFSATVPTLILSFIGQNSMTVTGTSAAAATMPLYMDFYLLLDNSPSMGVGATPADVNTMVTNTTDQCAFACHDTSNPNSYYDLAKSLGVTMRIDVLRQATQQLMDTASSIETYPNQFRMAIYTFGGSEATMGLTTITPLTSSLSTAKSNAGTIDLMSVTTPPPHTGNTPTGDQDTNFTTLFPQMNNVITGTPGTGTSASPLKYLLFVSDGVADESNSGCLKPMKDADWGDISPRCMSPIDQSLCTTIKNRGIKIAVLYTTYLALPTNQWYNDWIAPFNIGPYGPSPNSEIAQDMQACASAGYYFEVSPTQGISDAMNKLFQKAVADAHISG